MTQEFNYIQDAGHGWLEVPIELINELGISEQISRYSYKNSENGYLEEDCDAAKFFNAYELKFGHKPVLFDTYAGTNWNGRNYSHFSSVL